MSVYSKSIQRRCIIFLFKFFDNAGSIEGSETINMIPVSPLILIISLRYQFRFYFNYTEYFQISLVGDG